MRLCVVQQKKCTALNRGHGPHAILKLMAVTMGRETRVLLYGMDGLLAQLSGSQGVE